MTIRSLAVLTSGGDAPGMNAAVRAVVRRGLDLGIETFGIEGGYLGLMNGNIRRLGRREVGGILGRGGTVLGTARAPEFKTEAGQNRAIHQMAKHGVEGLVVIGGNGSQSGAQALIKRGFPVVGIASTIDNDLVGFDITIGVDTALNTIVQAIDRIRDTATSHNRAFVVEVMGRDCGYLGLVAGIASGAELAIVPEVPVTIEEVVEVVRNAYAQGKPHCIIVLSEGLEWTPQYLCDRIGADASGFEIRPIVLGHIQRGGSPTVFDRIMATRLGAAAVEALVAGKTGVVVGIANGHVAEVPTATAIAGGNKVDPELYRLAGVLAR